MKIQVMPQELGRRIAQVQRAISSRTTMPILECIRFEAMDDELTLTGTDLELTIVTSMPAKVIEEGMVVIPATMIGNIFRKLPASEATLEEKGGVVSIRCQDSHFKLQVSKPDEFPSLPDIDAMVRSVLPSDTLQRGITETEFATSQDESKIALMGIEMERRPGSLRLVTLDGYRLALSDLALSPNSDEIEDSMIVPKRAMLEWSKIVDPEGETSIYGTSTHIQFSCGQVDLYSRLIDKSFINYEEIIATDRKMRITLSRQVLRDAIERASLLTQSERAHLIKLDFQEDGLHIASNSEIGQVEEFVEAKVEGGTLLIAFNAKYLLDGVRALNSEELVLYLNGALNPMVIRPAEDEESSLYLVLPVRIAGE